MPRERWARPPGFLSGVRVSGRRGHWKTHRVRLPPARRPSVRRPGGLNRGSRGRAPTGAPAGQGRRGVGSRVTGTSFGPRALRSYARAPVGGRGLTGAFPGSTPGRRPEDTGTGPAVRRTPGTSCAATRARRCTPTPTTTRPAGSGRRRPRPYPSRTGAAGGSGRRTPTPRRPASCGRTCRRTGSCSPRPGGRSATSVTTSSLHFPSTPGAGRPRPTSLHLFPTGPVRPFHDL